jgi:hypothetical protein
MDISADLHELGRCPVGLVSAGVKSILDIGRSIVSICLPPFNPDATTERLNILQVEAADYHGRI